jgi:hypothetical protein
MKNIESYYNKIDAVLAQRASSKTGKSSKRGLLAPSGNDNTTSKKENSQMMAIADIIESIREARKEILNAKQ